MTPGSLRLRLAVLSAVSVGIAVVLAGMGLAALFERHVVRRVNTELETYVRQLAGYVAAGADGALVVTRPLADARFNEPLSGLYWQVDDETRPARLRSRSLWDHVLALPNDPLEPGSIHHHRLIGPGNTALLVAERRIVLQSSSVPQRLRIAAGLDEKEVAEARAEFTQDMVKALGVLAAILLVAAWAQVTVGLEPLERLRQSVAGVRTGATSRLPVDGPEEVLPLVREVNALLDEKAKTVDTAKARAADLAHGLKTPLAVLVGDAERLKKRGENDIAAEIEDIVAGMRRHIDWELSRARLQARAHRHQGSASVADCCARLVKVMSRTPEGSKLEWHVDIGEDVRVAMPMGDLTELLGVVLENAGKWARHTVRVTAMTEMAVARITIADDGAGVPEQKLGELGRRGVRLDEKTEGSGLGLAIATGIAEAYGGSVNFEAGKPSGLAVTVLLPR